MHTMASNRRGKQHPITREVLAAIGEAMELRGVDEYELAELVDVDRSTIQRILRAVNQSSPHLPKVCKVLGIPYDAELSALRGSGDVARNPKKVPIVGYVGAGDLYSWQPESGPWVGFDFIDPPPGAEQGIAAVIVRGVSMEPVYREGDVLFFLKGTHPEDVFLGRDCVVQVRGQAAYIKKVTKGTKPGRYTLVSWGKNPPMENVDLEWAAPIKHITRR
jgi:hypothetical protein